MCYNNKGCTAFAFLFLIQRRYNSATFHACAMKGSAAYGKKSTKRMKIHILALRVPGASLQLQAQRGDIAHVGTVHSWGQCTAGDIAHVEQCTRGDSTQVGTVHTWGQYAGGDKEGKCYD